MSTCLFNMATLLQDYAPLQKYSQDKVNIISPFNLIMITNKSDHLLMNVRYFQTCKLLLVAINVKVGCLSEFELTAKGKHGKMHVPGIPIRKYLVSSEQVFGEKIQNSKFLWWTSYFVCNIVHLKVFILTYKIFFFFPLVTLVYAAVLILKSSILKTHIKLLKNCEFSFIINIKKSHLELKVTRYTSSSHFVVLPSCT